MAKVGEGGDRSDSLCYKRMEGPMEARPGIKLLRECSPKST